MGLGASNDPIGAQGAHASGTQGGGRSAASGGGGHRASWKRQTARAPQDPNWCHIAIHLV
jgi:hypothetical protein